MRRTTALRTVLAAAAALLLAHCTTTRPRDPLVELSRRLDSFPVYSVVLEDMRETGNFIDTYEHRYRIVAGEPAGEGSEPGAVATSTTPPIVEAAPPATSPVEASPAGEAPAGEALAFREWTEDWVEVPEDLYRRHQDDLGMVILAKEAGEAAARETIPPGYQYVGDSRYGRWERDPSGNSFWAFYGRYALLSHLFGGLRGPVYRDDWNTYRDYRGRGQTYYGPGRAFGTGGTVTQTTHRTFYERQTLRQASSRQRFSDKVKSRASRSNMSGVRSRSGGSGGK